MLWVSVCSLTLLLAPPLSHEQGRGSSLLLGGTGLELGGREAPVACSWDSWVLLGPQLPKQALVPTHLGGHTNPCPWHRAALALQPN